MCKTCKYNENKVMERKEIFFTFSFIVNYNKKWIIIINAKTDKGWPWVKHEAKKS